MSTPSVAAGPRRFGQLLLVLVLGAPLVFGGCGADNASGIPPDLALEAKPPSPKQGDTISVTATVVNGFGLALSHSWTVFDPAGEAVALTAAHGSSITFVAQEGGAYKVTCSVEIEGSGQRQQTITVDVAPASATPVTYLARVVPPPESGLAPFDQPFVVSGVDKTETWTLPTTRQVSLALSHEGQALAAFALVLLGPDDAQPQRLYLPAGQGSVALSGAASVLLMPESDQVAPLLRTVGQTSSALTVALTNAEVGTPLLGAVDQGGVALPGAKVALHTVDAVSGIDVPSTVGQTAADGSFTLLARPGRATLVVVPPAQQALPMVRVSDPQLELTAGGGSWAFSYDSSTPLQIGGTVTDADGKPLVAARVAFSAELDEVGTLLQGGKSYRAVGTYRVELSTDASGALVGPAGPLHSLPAGRYAIEIRPPSGHTASYTRRQEQLSASTTLALTAERKARVSGKVLDSAGEPLLARVELRAAQGTSAAVVDQAGSFELWVDRGLDYALAIRPLVAASNAPLLQSALRVDGDTTLTGLQLTRAVEVRGVLQTTSGSVLSGASIRVSCQEEACPRQGLIDETRSGAGGAFVLHVPAEKP